MIAVIVFSVGVEQHTTFGHSLVPVSWIVCILFRAGLCSAQQDSSVISIQCLVMTHYPDKCHQSLCRENLPSWEAHLNRCGLEEILGAEAPPLTHTELSPILLRLAQELPTSTHGCLLGTHLRLQALDSRLQNYSLPDSSFGICQNLGRGLCILSFSLEPKLDCSSISSKDQDPARIISAVEKLGGSQILILALSGRRLSHLVTTG